jgi:hypothetical protein
MPDPYERHARTKDSSGWENQNPRSARAVAAAEPEVKRPPAKKDKDLCKAQHWKGPHTPVFEKKDSSWRKNYTCSWRTGWSHDRVPEWHCVHEEVCSGCGKVLNSWLLGERCPDYHLITEEEQALLEAEIERWNLRRVARVRPPKERTGYRKKKV